MSHKILLRYNKSVFSIQAHLGDSIPHVCHPLLRLPGHPEHVIPLAEYQRESTMQSTTLQARENIRPADSTLA